MSSAAAAPNSPDARDNKSRWLSKEPQTGRSVSIGTRSLRSVPPAQGVYQ